MRRLIQILILIFVCGAAWAENQFKIITLQHRFGQDLLPALQPLAGQGGVVSASGNHLFVDVPSERMTAIEQAVAQLDVESRTYRIRVDRSGSKLAEAWVTMSGYSARAPGPAGTALSSKWIVARHPAIRAEANISASWMALVLSLPSDSRCRLPKAG
jgi:hypothetical protein